MITKRDLCIAAGAIALTLGTVGLAHADKAILGPAVYDWEKLEAKPTDVGNYRHVVRQPTATLDELEMHITTLNPGLSSHAPHTHVNEELVIIKEGTVEVLSDGKWVRIGPGSVVFNASNSLHALRNVGTTPAVYHVINWSPD